MTPTPPYACPFCTFPRERIVSADALALLVRDAYLISAGHTLIVPRRHVASIAETTPDEVRSPWSLPGGARRALDETRKPDGHNVGINDGVAAGRTVMHLPCI
jgi:diadenosine tetraphosphate (Ap4A) HIT family hydrolase